MSYDVFEFRDLWHGFIAIVRMLFGDFVFDELEAGDRVFGTVFFLLVVLMLTLVLMNMLIAVISDVYITIQKRNVEVWQIEINHLLLRAFQSGKVSAIDWVFAFFLSLPLVRRTYIWWTTREFRREQHDAIELITVDPVGNEIPREIPDEPAPIPKKKDTTKHQKEEKISPYNDSKLDELALALQIEKTERSSLEIHEEIIALRKDVGEIENKIQLVLKEIKLLQPKKPGDDL